MQKLNTRKQIRLPNYDYSENGYYFVTICSSNRQPIFGGNNPRTGNHFQLSPIGRIVEQQWRDIPNRYDNVDLDEYVMMPDHIHGVLIFNGSGKRAGARPAPTLADIVCSFKSRSAVEALKYIRQNNLNVSGKIWQRSFYEHVIRNERSLNAIRAYMAGNPVSWALDFENSINL